MNCDISDGVMLDKTDNFKKSFKYYKSSRPKPSLADVVQFENCNFKHLQYVQEDKRTSLLGLKNVKDWKLCELTNHLGLLVLLNPFTSIGQRYWIRKCLEVYPCLPNKKNIDIEANLSDWWAHCHENNCNKHWLKKLRWTTFGYHHNWDTKVYNENSKSPFPKDLAELCDMVANYFNYKMFKAEAAIVNFYHMDSTLSPHTDHSEINLQAPLFSFSFGQSAIFLIGGTDKSVVPTALMLNSGDVLIMSEEARISYHAVPKILPAPAEPWNEPCPEFTPTIEHCSCKYLDDIGTVTKVLESNALESEWQPFQHYVKESRINVNVRQVLNNNSTSL